MTPRPLRSGTARWALPAAVVAALGLGVGGASVVGADPGLPPRTAADLLAGLADAEARPFSGTVIQTAELGLPALPAAATKGSTSLTSLASGSHTVRVWYAGPEHVRAALLGTLAETDVIRNGRDLWTWTSDTNRAQHVTLPAARGGRAAAAEDALPRSITPQKAAERALAAVDPTTEVRVDGTAEVAGRPAYELVLEPRDERSLVRQVRLAVDSETSVPLRVQVFADGSPDPAFETGFQSVAFARPADSVFRFTPPPGAKVSESDLGEKARPAARPGRGGGRDAKRAAAGARPTVVGKGWTAVAVTSGVRLEGTPGDPTAAAVLRAFTPVSGAYGEGRLLRTALVSVLLLDDGRLLAGAVQPQVLFDAAAASRPAR